MPVSRPVKKLVGTALLALFLLAALACDSTDFVSGLDSAILFVETQTTGANPDPDGYQVSLAGVMSADEAIAVNATMTFTSIAEGDVTVTLSDMAANCAVAQNPQTANLIRNQSVTVTFAVDCP